MAKLHRELAESLLECSSAQKEAIGNQIVLSLGGDITKKTISLPPRRGNSDGGIDGRIPIIIEIIQEFKRGNKTLYFETIKKETEAAFNIKIESSNFNRNELNAFIGDMQRERIYDGIIVSVKPLSMDAKSEFLRHNSEGNLRIRHILVEDLLAGTVNIDFELLNGESFKTNFNNAIKLHISNG